MGSDVTVPALTVAGVGDNTVDVYVDEGVGYPGGNALNFSVFARRLGADSSYIGVLGSDARSDHVYNALLGEGVRLDGLRRTDSPNAIALVTHSDGDRHFLGSDPSTSQSLGISDTDRRYLSVRRLVHTSVFSKLDGYLDKIKPDGGVLSYDFSNKFDNAFLVETLPFLDYAFLSFAGRAVDMIGSFLDQLRARFATEVVVTAGSAGSFTVDERGELLHSAPERIDPVDTLGAGDAFITRYLLARLSGRGRSESLEAGNEYAAQMCMIKGSFGWGALLDGGDLSSLRARIKGPAEGGASQDA